ncbi:hypothetical protein SDC9_147260 [bioreactor metagenome]|uniref:Uncharacterized protein n=1 Tax=bioreactor metagenome TaxID=1076179 RepID=A0A645EF74_9ZZZZ
MVCIGERSGVKGATDQAGFGQHGAPRGGGHAAKRQPCVGDDAVLMRDRKSGEDGRDVLIVAFGHFPRPDQRLAVALAVERDTYRTHELAGGQVFLLIAKVERLEWQLALLLASLQHDFGTDRDQRGHGVSDRAAVGNVAAQRAGIADGSRRKAPPEFGEFRVVRQDVVEGVLQRDGSADLERICAEFDAGQFAHATEIEQYWQCAELLGDP